MKNWPKLSETLTEPRDIGRCQSCGNYEQADMDRLVSRWLEHDEDDCTTPVFVQLCVKCSDKLIEPHPRLYSKLDRYMPMPGAMDICEDCVFRKGLDCTSAKAQANGGDGLKITYPTPAMGFVDGRDKKTGKKFGRSFTHYVGPATACDGRVLKTGTEVEF